MAWGRPSVWTLLLATSVVSAASAQDTKRETIPQTNISIEIPASAEFTKDQGTYDFSVYRVTLGARQLLGAYVGMHAQIPSRETPQFLRVGNCLVKSFTRTAPKGLKRDVYVTFTLPILNPYPKPGEAATSGTYKSAYHFFYSDLSPDEAGQSDTIINSITVTGEPACDRS